VWGTGVITPPFLVSALDGSEWSVQRSGRFTSGERAHGIHWIGGWVGLRTGLDAVEKKSLNPAGNRTPAVQPVAFTILAELSQ
jgi:hypothetical protein